MTPAPTRLITILRLGLRQFAAGLLSVLTLGILNRIMKVEMGLDLTLVSIVVSAHYFAAPLAVPLGHRSDTRPYFGYHRSPYILAGAATEAQAVSPPSPCGMPRSFPMIYFEYQGCAL